MISIRLFDHDKDWELLWRQMLEPVFRAGDTYTVPTDVTEEQAYKMWIETPQATFVATNDGGALLGTYYIKPNQPGFGNHVCNCGYVTAESARGQGVASRLCEHSLQEAPKRGFRAMQYNFVVSTNTGAIRLWKKFGFEEVGRLPKAFRYNGDYLDALVMFQQLVDDDEKKQDS
ncbi:Gcn5-related n-acetyltransferase [Seminavis robusta]|uniref:Gcn5-related n-acetyltransferase n=1 Tax=Seminavis robusta TaxID=568900 RepID=A0A9N8HTX9_9STRA|nr:Gcn5-related n-acetyltransferase [Seminavis robusta]|eukprot:Sro1664_g289520.1 Gcn5-related n-acetyltransferase (174) ;mRNA; r:20349-20870